MVLEWDINDTNGIYVHIYIHIQWDVNGIFNDLFLDAFRDINVFLVRVFKVHKANGSTWNPGTGAAVP